MQPLKSVSISLLLVLLAACGGTEPTPNPEPRPSPIGTPTGDPVAIAIGPNGGSLVSADGRLTVKVPVGALSAVTQLSVRSISNTAPQAKGNAYRLEPHGLSFAKPVTLTFTYTDADLTTTSAGGLGIAYQDDKGVWWGHPDTQLDEAAKTLSVKTTHFSDWSYFEAFRLTPHTATLKVGASLDLTVETCYLIEPDDDVLAPLGPSCKPFSLAPLIRNPAVNGVAGGDATVGTVSRAEGLPVLSYTAPGRAPESNPVALSVEITLLNRVKLLLVANVTVEEGVCDDLPLSEACRFELAKVNGKAIPYEDLPRDDWENPEVITGGVLILRDSDGDGAGDYSLRYEWTEDRGNGNTLEQFVQDAGYFEPNGQGGTAFESLGGAAFSGKLEDNTATVQDFPLSTKNATVAVKLQFNR